MAQSLKTYLSNRTDVQGARRTLLEVSGELNLIKKQWENTPKTADNYQDILAAYKDAQAKYKDAERALNLAESNDSVDNDSMNRRKKVK